MLLELISQLPEETALLTLLSDFDKLLKKYARILSYEDAYSDLQLFFIELVLKLKDAEITTNNNGAVVNYISKAIKNHYISLSKKKEYGDVIIFSDLSDGQMFYVDSIMSNNHEPSISDFFPAKHSLSRVEVEILMLFFDYGYSSAEIARLSGKSRQAVNQTKIRALNKIKTCFSENQ